MFVNNFYFDERVNNTQADGTVLLYQHLTVNILAMCKFLLGNVDHPGQLHVSVAIHSN